MYQTLNCYVLTVLYLGFTIKGYRIEFAFFNSTYIQSIYNKYEYSSHGLKPVRKEREGYILIDFSPVISREHSVARR